MAKRRLRLREGIELRRAKGQTAADIASYVFRKQGTSWRCMKFSWTLPEHEELQRLDQEAAERKAEIIKKMAAADQPATCSPSPPKRRANLRGRGLTSKDVQKALGCSIASLNRWAKDGRFPPDGELFFHAVGPLGGSKWRRAWSQETVDSARAYVDNWRQQDRQQDIEARPSRWVSQARLFELVKYRFPDAISQWDPDWLRGQSVDIYLPKIRVAIEYQGRQHYEPVSIFGGEEGFRDTQARDARKRSLLLRNGIELVEWRFDIPIEWTELGRVLALVRPAITA